MRATLLAVGTGMPAWVEAGFGEYARRLSHWLPLELVEIAPGERGKGRDAQRAMEDEGRRLLAAIPRNAHVVLLDSGGRTYASERLAQRLEHWRMQGRDLAFLVGGPEGFAGAVREAAHEGWSLGASPDGLVGVDGGIEIKCPKAKTHIRTILADEVPAYNMAQCQAGLLITGRQWLDFISFCAGMPLYIKRVHPDPQWFAAIKAAAIHAEDAITDITGRYTEATAGLPATDRIPDPYAEIAI